MPLTRDIPAELQGGEDRPGRQGDLEAGHSCHAEPASGRVELVETGPNYAYVLRQVSDRVKNDATVKSDVKGHLRDKLENAPKF